LQHIENNLPPWLPRKPLEIEQKIQSNTAHNKTLPHIHGPQKVSKTEQTEVHFRHRRHLNTKRIREMAPKKLG